MVQVKYAYAAGHGGCELIIPRYACLIGRGPQFTGVILMSMAQFMMSVDRAIQTFRVGLRPGVQWALMSVVVRAYFTVP